MSAPTRKHRARYRLFDSKCECSCGWIVQANDKAEGLAMVAAHKEEADNV